jgi:two-component system, NtrC family, sensor kinase
MIVDVKGRISLANGGCTSLTGYAPGELVGANLQDLCAPYERNRYIFSSLSEITETAELDVDLRRKTGGSLVASVSFAPFRYQGRSFLLLVMRDVTTKRVEEGQIREREERHRKLLAERDALETQLIRSSKLACLGEIAGGIAHEINNPLGIIIGFAQDLLDEMPQDHPFHESVRIIEQETSRCVEFVKSLLDYARLKPPQIVPADLTQLLEECVSLLKPRIRKNKIRVKRSLAPDLPAASVDPHLLQQAFLNVMINAIQAMPYGGELTVETRLVNRSCAEQEKNRICITISDTGHGIPTDHLDRIFDPFFSTKGSKGTGLGLSVCQRIIEDHFGRIEVDSSETQGTRCRVYLPLQ